MLFLNPPTRGHVRTGATYKISISYLRHPFQHRLCKKCHPWIKIFKTAPAHIVRKIMSKIAFLCTANRQIKAFCWIHPLFILHNRSMFPTLKKVAKEIWKEEFSKWKLQLCLGNYSSFIYYVLVTLFKDSSRYGPDTHTDFCLILSQLLSL